MYGMNSVRDQIKYLRGRRGAPAISCVRMTWAGPKSARSKVGKAVGEPSQTNLDANNQLVTACSAMTYRINAETLSKQYWLNFGLLGFLLISPIMLTSRVRTASCIGVKLCRAVMMTRIAPCKDQYRNHQHDEDSHFMW